MSGISGIKWGSAGRTFVALRVEFSKIAARTGGRCPFALESHGAIIALESRAVHPTMVRYHVGAADQYTV